MTRRQDEIRAAGLTAEHITSSPRFRSADTNGFDGAAHHTLDDVQGHMDARTAATKIIFETYSDMPRSASEGDIAWEAQRRVALATVLGSNALTTSFDKYFLELPALSRPGTKTSLDLPAGEREAVRINSQLLHLRDVTADPFQFMESALDRIAVSTKMGGREKSAPGPENYTTALKFFTDKLHIEKELSSHDKASIGGLVSQTLDGFFRTAERDMPNFVEMNNLYVSFLRLPAGAIDARFTKDIVKQSLNVLPEYSADTTRLMIASLSKLEFQDSAEDGEAVARLVNLGLRKAGPFERTSDLRNALRIVSRLPKTLAADRSLIAILAQRQDVEKAATIEDAYEIVTRIRNIADNVVGSNDIYQALKTNIAEPALESARKHFHTDRLRGNYTPDQEADYLNTLQRISATARAI